MIIDNNSLRPIYLQISDWLESEILCGNIHEDEKMYSQYQLAEMFNINPATAAKGISILSEAGMLYKKRGLGMFVSPGAFKAIREKRKHEVLSEIIDELVLEANRLSVDKADLIKMITSAYEGVEDNDNA